MRNRKLDFSTDNIAWTFLLFAIITEVAGTTSMKLSAGFTHPAPSILIFVFYGFSLAFLTFSLKRLEVGFAYAIWSGLGTMLIFLIGIAFFHEQVTLLRVISLSLVIIGVMGLKQS